MTDIERIIATIKDYQDKNLSLEDLQSYFQTLPLCLYFSAQQIEELEEQLETIRFLISDEMQHETVIHYLKPMKNYLESLRSSKIVPLIENLITGKDISIENAQHIEVLLDDYYENDEVIQDFITDLALYNPGGGEYLYNIDWTIKDRIMETIIILIWNSGQPTCFEIIAKAIGKYSTLSRPYLKYVIETFLTVFLLGAPSQSEDEIVRNRAIFLGAMKGYTQKEIVKKFCESNLKQIKEKEKNEELPLKTQELKSSLLDIYKFACE